MHIPDSYYGNQKDAIKFAEEGPFLSEKEQITGQEGLTQKEMLCLRLGVDVGQGDAELILARLAELAPLCSKGELKRILAEVVLIRGERGRRLLVGALEESSPDASWKGISPIDLIDLALREQGISLSERITGLETLTHRELSLLGIGITFGARCWYS